MTSLLYAQLPTVRQTIIKSQTGQFCNKVYSLLTGLVLIFMYEALEKVQYGGHILTAARQRTAGKELKMDRVKL